MTNDDLISKVDRVINSARLVEEKKTNIEISLRTNKSLCSIFLILFRQGVTFKKNGSFKQFIFSPTDIYKAYNGSISTSSIHRCLKILSNSKMICKVNERKQKGRPEFIFNCNVNDIARDDLAEIAIKTLEGNKINSKPGSKPGSKLGGKSKV